MADVNNSLDNLIFSILGGAIAELRQQSIMPRLVRNFTSDVAAQKGSTVDVPLQMSIPTRDVTPDSVSADPGALTAPMTQIVLSSWREAPFVLSDKEVGEIADGLVPRAVKAAAQSLAEFVDAQILSNYTGIYNVGLPQPFNQDTVIADAFVTDATNNPSGLRAFREARAWMNREGAPTGGRQVVLSALDESDALALSQFTAADQRGDQGGIIEGQIGRKLGADWFMDQAIPNHTSGTQADEATEGTNDANLAIGVTSMAFSGTIAATIKTGDVFRFAGHDQTYVVLADVTLDGSGDGTVTFAPGLKVAVSSGSDVDFLLDHAVNLLFHPDAIGFASRPLQGIGSGNYASVVDPVSGLAIRAEVSRQHKRDLFSLDVLFGSALLEPKLAARIVSSAR